MSFFSRIAQTFRQQGVLTQLIIINAVVYLTVNVVGNLAHQANLLSYLAMPADARAFLPRFWTLFTYMFTHEGLGHLFWNMVTFYFMAQVFFILFRQRKMLYVYVMSGLCGGALVLIMGLIFPGTFGGNILLGASAAILGVGGVMAVYTPDYRISLFGVFELAYKYLYLIIFILTTVIDLADNTGGKISHMGGAAFGLIYGYQLKHGRDFLNFSFGRKKKPKLKVVSHNKTYQPIVETSNKTDEQQMDALLDKISKSGYDSLTKSEKEELFRLSQKK